MRKNRMKIFFEIKESIKRGDEFYKHIKLPKPKKIGTYTQKNTYANLAAQKVYNEYKKSIENK